MSREQLHWTISLHDLQTVHFENTLKTQNSWVFVVVAFCKKWYRCNEHERLLHYIYTKEQRCYCCSTFHSHSKVFNNNDNHWYLKYALQQYTEVWHFSYPAAERYTTSVDERYKWPSLSFWCNLVYNIWFGQFCRAEI